MQIYGINQDVDANNQILGLTFGPAVGANYNNSYVTHTYEDNSDGTYNMVIVTHTIAEDGTETMSTEYLRDSNNAIVTRTLSQKELFDVNIHNMSWSEIKQTSDKTVFTDCMLCGDTKSIIMDLNNTIASGSEYAQYGDGAGMLLSTIKYSTDTNEYYRIWNLNQSQNSYVGTGVTLDNNEKNNGNALEGLGTNGDGYNKFGNSQSKYYISSYNGNDNTSRIAYNESGYSLWWWLRSPILNNTYPVHCIDRNGNCNASWNPKGNSSGLAFGFCIQ